MGPLDMELGWGSTEECVSERYCPCPLSLPPCLMPTAGLATLLQLVSYFITSQSSRELGDHRLEAPGPEPKALLFP